MLFSFVVLTFVLFGAALFFAYRAAKRDFQAQLKAVSRNFVRRSGRVEKRLERTEQLLGEAVAVINQLKMSAPNHISTPSTPDWRKNVEDRHVAEARKDIKVLGKGNN